MAIAKVGASGTVFLATTGASVGMTGGYGQSPTAGNLLIMSVTMSTTVATATSCTTPAGWTAGPAGGAPTGTANYKAALYIFWKVAAGADTAPVVTVAGGTYSTAVVIEEFSGITSATVDAASTVVTKNTAGALNESGNLVNAITTTSNPTLLWSMLGQVSETSTTSNTLDWASSTKNQDAYFGAYVRTSTASKLVVPGSNSASVSWSGTTPNT